MTGPFTRPPNSRRFNGLLREAAGNLERTTHELDRLMHNWPDDDGLRGELKLLEREGDRITHDVIHELHATAVTPLSASAAWAAASRASGTRYGEHDT